MAKYMAVLLNLIFVLFTTTLAQQYKTDAATCIQCYKDGMTHCINKAFDRSACCSGTTPEAIASCQSGFDYCTTGLSHKTYKVLTCPQANCPTTSAYAHEATALNQEVEHDKTWGFWETGLHCKMVLSASANLNGKLRVKITNVNDAEVHVFKMPKHFNANYGYVGFFENNDYYTYQKKGTYEVPSDWVIFIQYNTFVYDGSISISSEVVEYDASDISKIQGEWEPTGTYWVNRTALAEIKAAKIAEEKRIAKALDKALQDAKDEAEQQKLRAAAARAAEVERQKNRVIADREELARIKVQETKKADFKSISVNQLQIKNPEGLYFNQEIVVFIVAVGSGLFLCGLSIACCIVRQYKKQKDQLLKQILNPENYPAEGLDGFALDKNGNVVKKGSLTRGQEGQPVVDFYGQDSNNSNRENEIVEGNVYNSPSGKQGKDGKQKSTSKVWPTKLQDQDQKEFSPFDKQRLKDEGKLQKQGPLDGQWSFVELDDAAAKRKSGTVNVQRSGKQTKGGDIENKFDPFDPQKKQKSVKTPATIYPRRKGKAGMIAEEGKEEEDYDVWLKQNKEIRTSISELPGEGNEDLPVRAFSKNATKRMDKNQR